MKLEFTWHLLNFVFAGSFKGIILSVGFMLLNIADFDLARCSLYDQINV